LLIPGLLSYLRRMIGTGWNMSPESLARLEKAAAPSAKSEIAVLRQTLDQCAERERTQLANLAPLLQGGDFNRGHELFLTTATCARCHRVGQHGGLVGPDLTKIGA